MDDFFPHNFLTRCVLTAYVSLKILIYVHLFLRRKVIKAELLFIG